MLVCFSFETRKYKSFSVILKYMMRFTFFILFILGLYGLFYYPDATRQEHSCWIALIGGIGLLVIAMIKYLDGPLDSTKRL